MSDDDNVTPIGLHGRMPAANVEVRLLPCTWCGDETKVSTLSLLGARCARCYAAYCRAPLPNPAQPAAGEKDRNPKAWADVLAIRHKAGDALTNAQIDAYRAALRPRSPNSEGADL